MVNLFDMKYIRECTSLSREELAMNYGIPLEKLTAWEEGTEEAPDYLYFMLLSAMDYDSCIEYSPVSTLSPKFYDEFDAPIINTEMWKAAHPHCKALVKHMCCGCHSKLIGYETYCRGGGTRLWRGLPLNGDSGYEIIYGGDTK